MARKKWLTFSYNLRKCTLDDCFIILLDYTKILTVGEVITFYGGFFCHGATAPSGSGPPNSRGFTITLRDTHTHTHSIGLLCLSDQPEARTST